MSSSVHAPTHEHKPHDLIHTCYRPRSVLVPHENPVRARAHCTRALHKAFVGAHCMEAHTHTHELMYARPLLEPICTRALHEACGRIPHKNTCSRIRAILVPCTGTVRSSGLSTHVASNEALSHAHMLGTQGRTRTLPQYIPVFTQAVQGSYMPISTRTNSAHVPKHAPNAVDRPVPVQHGPARVRAVSDRVGDLCRHERRL